MDVFTTGVYHSSEEEFFRRITEAGIDLFCDIRHRRGVRGSEYAYANSARLQAALSRLGIAYLHIPALAPTDAIQHLQTEHDKRSGEGQRSRNTLAPEFTAAYTHEILDQFDLGTFVATLQHSGHRRILFFCVEEHAEACHRSILAQRLADRYHLKVTHLQPALQD